MIAALAGAAVVSISLLPSRIENNGEALEAEAGTEAGDSLKLPALGSWPADFVPAGWTLMDSAALDFNGDGIEDYVGVLEHAGDGEEGFGPFCPRILFAVAGEGEGVYRLDFQDGDLIRTEDEGGPFGDPYEPLTVEGAAFTTHSYGGSSWKWSEAYTYARRDGTWYLMKSETAESFGPYLCAQSTDDYGTGIGVRRRRSCEDEDIARWMDGGSEDIAFDLVYQVPLDPPPTLFQAGLRRSLSSGRMESWPVESVSVADGIELDPELVRFPQEEYGCLTDAVREEGCLLYHFTPHDGERTYLALYREKDRAVSVVAEDRVGIESPSIYRDKIYYTSPLMGQIGYQDGSGTISQAEGRIGARLCRVNPDGSDRREIFRYVLAEAGSGVVDRPPPHVSLLNEFNGGGIVTEVYIEGRPHLFYRMGLDGEDVQMVGTVPASP